MERQRIEDEQLVKADIARREREFETRLKVEQARAESEQRQQAEMQRLADERRIKEREAELFEQKRVMEDKLSLAMQALRDKEDEARRGQQRLSELEQEKSEQAYRLELELLETEIRMAQEAKDEVASAAEMLREQKFGSISLR